MSVILSADVRRFLRVGVKVTLAMQLAFTERPAPPIGQLWVCAKFAVFPLAMVMPEMIRFDPLYLKRPLLYVMLVTVGSNPESPFWGKPNSFVTRCHLESNPSDIRSALKRTKIAHTEERITIEFPVPTRPAKANSNERERSTIEHDAPKVGKVFKAIYKGKPYTMKVVNGEDGGVAYQVGKDVFKNPSAAGKAVIGGACNGWRFWGIEQQS